MTARFDRTADCLVTNCTAEQQNSNRRPDRWHRCCLVALINQRAAAFATASRPRSRPQPLLHIPACLQADILMVTDGEIPQPSEQVLERLAAAHEELGLEVGAILLLPYHPLLHGPCCMVPAAWPLWRNGKAVGGMTLPAGQRAWVTCRRRCIAGRHAGHAASHSLLC